MKSKNAEEIRINNTTISKHALLKIIKKKLSTFNTFVLLDSKLNIDNNQISIKLHIEFNQKLKTYKPIVDMIESETFNTVFYFTTLEPKIQIRLS